MKKTLPFRCQNLPFRFGGGGEGPAAGPSPWGSGALHLGGGLGGFVTPRSLDRLRLSFPEVRGRNDKFVIVTSWETFRWRPFVIERRPRWKGLTETFPKPYRAQV